MSEFCNRNDERRAPTAFENFVVSSVGMGVGKSANAGRVSEFKTVEGLIVVADDTEACRVAYGAHGWVLLIDPAMGVTPVTHTHALFANQRHFFPENLVAFLGYS